MKHLTLDPDHALPATRDFPTAATVPDALPDAGETKVHPSDAGGENARLLFVGTATTILYVSLVELWGEREGEKNSGRRSRGRDGVFDVLSTDVWGREWEGVRLMTDPVSPSPSPSLTTILGGFPFR